jgi:hypothetical protein
MKNFKTRALIFTPMDLLSKSLTKKKNHTDGVAF